MTESDFRALCAEQMADGPAVPEDREPASVAGKPSGENCWRWYAYCPEEGIEMYSDKKQAQSAAQSIMASYEVAAHSDGWHEDMESVSWGMLVPVEQAQVVERKTAEFYDEFSEWVKYELRPARYSHQPAPPAEREVATLLQWLRNMAGAKLGGHDGLYAARTAHLLTQRYPTPVPVSERLPGPGEMTEDEEVWVECEGNSYSIADTGDYDWEPHTWILKPIDRYDIKYNRRWLPSHALPLPAGEAQP